MITNLLASIVITLTTNVSERFPGHQGFGECPDHNPGCLAIHGNGWINDPDPKKKWVRTTVTKVKTLQFDFEGQRSVELSRETVSDSEVEFLLKRKDDWLAGSEKRLTNSGLVFTNSSRGFVIYTNDLIKLFPGTTNGISSK